MQLGVPIATSTTIPAALATAHTAATLTDHAAASTSAHSAATLAATIPASAVAASTYAAAAVTATLGRRSPRDALCTPPLNFPRPHLHVCHGRRGRAHAHVLARYDR